MTRPELELLLRLVATLENVLLHQGKHMTDADRTAREALLGEAREMAHPRWDPAGHWDEHRQFGVDDWRQEVENDDTRLGYHDWVNDQLDAEGVYAVHVRNMHTAHHELWVYRDADKARQVATIIGRTPDRAAVPPGCAADAVVEINYRTFEPDDIVGFPTQAGYQRASVRPVNEEVIDVW